MSQTVEEAFKVAAVPAKLEHFSRAWLRGVARAIDTQNLVPFIVRCAGSHNARHKRIYFNRPELGVMPLNLPGNVCDFATAEDCEAVWYLISNPKHVLQ